MEEFLHALAAPVGAEERLIICAVPGDPGLAPPLAWRPRAWRPGLRLPPLDKAWNGYVTVGAFGRAEDGTWRRRRECYRGGVALMVDDVGTDVDPAVMLGVPPSARIMTSPGNEQWWFMFEEPERDAAKFDALIRAFIAGPLGGRDPGMASVTRVGRLPGFRNCKAKYGPGGHVVELRELAPGRRYSVDELAGAWALKLEGRRERRARVPDSSAEERIAAWEAIFRWLEANDMMKRHEPDAGGWYEMTCPWVEDHTGAMDNGAALRWPDIENGFHGGFRCHHGSHLGRGWAELCEWVAERAAEQLEDVAQ